MKPLHILASTDGLRPQLNYIQLKNGFFSVTDGTKLFRCPVNEIFNETLISSLPAECYFLANDWKNSKIDKAHYLKLENNLIECMDKKFNTFGFLRFMDGNEFYQKIGNFPNVEAVWPKIEDKTEIDQISFNPEFLDEIYRANGKNPLYLEFYGKNRAIKIKFKDSEAEALLMPLQLSTLNN